MTNTHHTTIICPYWSIDQTRCRAHTEGLFLPLDSYVMTYCTSIRHVDCPHYRSCSGSAPLSDDSVEERLKASEAKMKHEN